MPNIVAAGTYQCRRLPRRRLTISVAKTTSARGNLRSTHGGKRLANKARTEAEIVPEGMAAAGTGATNSWSLTEVANNTGCKLEAALAGDSFASSLC